MDKKIDLTKVFPVKTMKGEDDEDSLLLKQMLTEAETYLRSHSWCDEIVETFWGIATGGIVAVFLFHIKPRPPCIDNFVWVITGDLPPLYITIDDAPNAACALDGYIGAMHEWCDAAIKGHSVKKLAPVNIEATVEHGIALRKRLEFLDREILVHYKSDFI